MWELLDIRVGRIGRLDFVMLQVFLHFSYQMHFFITYGIYQTITSSKGLNPYYFVLMCALPFLYLQALVHTRRLRDCGITIWAAMIGIFGQIFLDSLYIYKTLSIEQGLSKSQFNHSLHGLEFPFFVFAGISLLYYFILISKDSVPVSETSIQPYEDRLDENTDELESTSEKSQGVAGLLHSQAKKTERRKRFLYTDAYDVEDV